MASHNEIGEFIWRIADHLRGDYEKNDNEDVILPFTLLRRLDCVLEKTRDKVREAEAQLAGKVTEDVLKKLLISTAGVLLLMTVSMVRIASISSSFGNRVICGRDFSTTFWRRVRLPLKLR